MALFGLLTLIVGAALFVVGLGGSVSDGAARFVSYRLLLIAGSALITIALIMFGWSAVRPG